MMTPLLALIELLIPAQSIPCSLGSIERVLVVDLNFLGDMLMSSPVYRALKHHFPGSRVDVLAYRMVEPVLHANPYIDTIHLIEGPARGLPLWALPALRHRRYDLVLQLNSSLTTNFLMFLIGGRYRLGYNYRARGCFNTIRVPIPTRTARSTNRVEECLGLLERAFGWTIADRHTILEVPEHAMARVGELLQAEHLADAPLLIGMHTNCRQGREERRWEGSCFAALADRLIVETGGTVVFSGGPEDRAYVESIVQKMSDTRHVRNFAGRLSLLETGALLRRFTLFITINTGPMHMAVALNTPTLAIIGGTPPSVVYPAGNPRFRHLMDPALRDYDPANPGQRLPPAINSITVDAVFAESVNLLHSLGHAGAERKRS